VIIISLGQSCLYNIERDSLFSAKLSRYCHADIHASRNRHDEQEKTPLHVNATSNMISFTYFHSLLTVAFFAATFWIR